jgi:serine/threonine-protein kinase TTK/MPS1
MKERVRVLSTPARRQAAAESAEATLAAASCAQPPGASVPPPPPAVPAAPHVTFAPGVGGTPMPGQPSAARTPYTANKTPAAAASNGGGVGAGAGIAGGRRRVSVDGLLTEYLRAQGSTPPHLRTEREQRVAALRECPTSAQMWCEFLEAEEAALGDDTTTAGVAGRNGVSLFRLFEHATRALPPVSRAAPHETQGYYLRLYLGLARQQMASNMDDARDTFKYLKSEGFWQKHAMFWSEWAAFGYRYKGPEKALKILEKGIESGEVAEGLGVLHDMKASIAGGVFGGGAHDASAAGNDTQTQTQNTGEGNRGGVSSSDVAPRAAPHVGSAAPTPRLRAGGGEYAHTSTIPPFAGAAADDATVPVPNSLLARQALNDENAPPRESREIRVPREQERRDATEDVTMEICSQGHAARARGEAPHLTSSRYAPTRMEEEATVAVPAPAPAAFSRQQSAPAAMVAAGRQHATAPASSTAAARAAAHAAAHAASAAASAAEDAAARKAEEKKKRPKIRENSEMVIVRGVKYLKLECVGQGGTCKVYKVLCPKRKTYALKRIKLAGREKETVAGFMDEIRLLQGLRGRDNIIQLVDAEVCKSEGLIYVVLEYGEIDLARLLSKREKQAKARSKSLPNAASGGGSSGSSGMIDDNFLRLYFEQMVEAVGTIHEQKIVHSDLKPANFLFVEGALKLIDFGIAKQDTSKSDTTNIVRDHQVGTVNYMSPEAILNGQPSALGGPLKVGRASDIWSLGCILYQMVYGQTPFARINGMIPKLHAITDPKHEIPMPPVANPHLVDLMRSCLARHPHRRITIDGILKHPFLRPAAAEVAATPGRGGAGVEAASPAPASGLSASQLTNLLEQIQKHGADVDVGAVTQEVFRQIAAGETNVSVSPLLRKHAKAPAAAAEAETAAAGTAETAAAAPLTGEQPAAPPKEPAVVEESSVPAATDAVDAMQEGVEAISLNEA